MIKTLLITNQIAPYRIPVYNIVNDSDDIDLAVWFLDEKEANRHWDIDYSDMQYKYRCLPGVHMFIQSFDFAIHLNPGLLARLIKMNPDVIITTSYDNIGYWVSLVYAKLFRKKFVVWWGSTLKSSRVRNKLMNSIRKIFFKSSDSFIAYGKDAAECLNYYDIQDYKIAVGYNTVDIKYYYQKYKEIKETSNNERLNLLFIGQLIKRKGLEEIILALSAIKSENWYLTIVGTGPEEKRLRELVRKKGLDNLICFEGYKQKEELIKYLAYADCLVFPSLIEVWGLVVNEALVTNTFVMTSKYAGATNDLITNKENGIIIDPLDQNSLMYAFHWMLSNISYIKSERRIRLSLWKKLHPKTYARSVIRAIKIANDYNANLNETRAKIL